MTKVAIEGIPNGMVPIARDNLESKGIGVAYWHESDPRDLMTPMGLVADMLAARPDVAIVCSSRNYQRFMQHYCTIIEAPPIVVLTGGGPDVEKEMKRYTPYVFGTPFTGDTEIKTWDQFARKLEDIAEGRDST